VLGQEKGDDTDSRIKHNFGMARPEGYRKAQRLMKLADRFGMPVLTLVDTSGAYPGIDAEARGQAEAVATSIDTCLSLGVPLVSVVIGEGGSGGALAIASADRVYMLENSIYSVISPEGCASILWRNNANAQDAAEAMKVTAADLKKLEVIDEVIPEPMGGAHRAPDETIDLVGKVVSEALGELAQFDPDTLRKNRQEKFLAMGKKGL
jgi:acetyl-CoA carboxylase carboxyl transferase subunit alpha